MYTKDLLLQCGYVHQTIKISFFFEKKSFAHWVWKPVMLRVTSSSMLASMFEAVAWVCGVA